MPMHTNAEEKKKKEHENRKSTAAKTSCLLLHTPAWSRFAQTLDLSL